MIAIWDRFNAALRWVYDWITVLAASLVGLPSMLLEVLSYLDGIDITPFIESDKALKIVTGIAITKALLAFIESRMKEE